MIKSYIDFKNKYNIFIMKYNINMAIRRKRKKLNEARLDVWGQHLSNDENTKLSERIIELDMKNDLTKDEEKELNMLLKMEQGLLSKSSEEVLHNKTIINQYYKCLDVVKNDERLTILFNVRFGDAMGEGIVNTIDDVNKIFHKMMEEEMEIDGHEKLKKEYNEIKEIIENDIDPIHIASCNDPECLYCAPITHDEDKLAKKRLYEEGFFESKFSEEEKMMKLMTQILRLEMVINDLEDSIEEDEDED